MKDNFKIFMFMFLIIGLATLGYFWKGNDNNMKKENIDGGVVKDNILPGYSDVIKSKEIVKFEYTTGDYYLSCEFKNNELHVVSRGGYSNERDGSYFKLGYNASNNTLLNDLQEIIDKYSISKDNGYEHETAGLPAGLGDSIMVLYSSGEKIWKYSNQFHTITNEASDAIYEAFRKCARDNNLDFDSLNSTEVLYDDADINYLQGSWKGTHFGREYIVKFYNNYVKIYENGKLIDDTKYTIINGYVVPNKIKENIKNPVNYHDYEEFSLISTMAKKNDFTLTAYFMKDSYSTCDLIKEN